MLESSCSLEEHASRKLHMSRWEIIVARVYIPSHQKDGRDLGLEPITEKCMALLIRNLMFGPRRKGGLRSSDPLFMPSFGEDSTIQLSDIQELDAGTGRRSTPSSRAEVSRLEVAGDLKDVCHKGDPVLYLLANDTFNYAVKNYAHRITNTNLCPNCEAVDDRQHQTINCTGDEAFH